MYLLHSFSILIKSYRYISIPSSITFVIQSLIIFTGLDQIDESENYNSNEKDDPAFRFLSLRNIINFLFGFSWTGILLDDTIESSALLFGVSLAVGIIFILLFLLISHLIQLLRKDNSFQIQHAVNKTAKVHLSIPENKKEKGKIIVFVNGVSHELEAMTENGPIENGTTVKVEKIAGNVLIVKQINYK